MPKFKVTISPTGETTVGAVEGDFQTASAQVLALLARVGASMPGLKQESAPEQHRHDLEHVHIHQRV